MPARFFIKNLAFPNLVVDCGITMTLKSVKKKSTEQKPKPVSETKPYFVYLLECKGGSLYTGITTDVERRFWEHKTGKGGHFTRSHKIIRVVYTEAQPDRSTALKREVAIKKLSRIEKLALAESQNKATKSPKGEVKKREFTSKIE